MSWKPAWWNVDFHKRANLKQFSPDLRLANDPWFMLKRENHLYTYYHYIDELKTFEQECHDQRCAHRVLNPAVAVETLLEIGFVTFPVLKHSKVSASRQKGEVGSGAEESEFA